MIRLFAALLFVFFPLFAKDYAYKTMAPADFDAPSKQLYAFLKKSEFDSTIDIKKLKDLLDQGADPNVFVNECIGDPDIWFEYSEFDTYEEFESCIASIPLNEITDSSIFCGAEIEAVGAASLIDRKKNVADVLRLFLEAGLNPNIKPFGKMNLINLILGGKFFLLNGGSNTVPDKGADTLFLNASKKMSKELRLLLQYGYEPNENYLDNYILYTCLDILKNYDFSLEQYTSNIGYYIFEFQTISESSLGSLHPFETELLELLLNNGLNPLKVVNGRTLAQTLRYYESVFPDIRRELGELIAIIKSYESVWRNRIHATESKELSSSQILPIENMKATSELQGDNKYSYTITNLTDKDTTTAWVEGNPRYGLHEGFFFRLPESAPLPQEITLRNGYTKNQKIWKANCRIQRVGITLDSTLIGIVDLQDTPKSQTANVRDIFHPFEETLYNGTIGIKIFSIYKGTKYKDIALSEFQVRGNKE